MCNKDSTTGATEASTNHASSDESNEVDKMTADLKETTIATDRSQKQHVNVVFCGHVDAGKSTIGGQLMYLTGMVDKRTLEKYEREAKEMGRESWYLSWALDTNDEERQKGTTNECGRAHFETAKKRFTILDTPGHKNLVRNMILGASQADLAVLVVSARRGEFETGFDRGGQTQEHAMLVRGSGVKQLIVLVNKMDDPTVEWAKERFTEIQTSLAPFLRKTCGFGKDDVTWIPVSGLTGAFMKERPDAAVCSWYTGPCFLDFIDNVVPSFTRDVDGPVRLIIASATSSDKGTTVIGKMESGVLKKGQTMLLMPNRVSVLVAQCSTGAEESTERVVSGDNAQLILKDISAAEIRPGFVLCSPDQPPCSVGRVFKAEVKIIECKSIICAGFSCALHIHNAEESVSIEKLYCTFDKRTNEKKLGALFVKQGEKCEMRLESTVPFCMERFEDVPQLGRFTLRDRSTNKTIAIGKVLEIVE